MLPSALIEFAERFGPRCDSFAVVVTLGSDGDCVCSEAATVDDRRRYVARRRLSIGAGETTSLRIAASTTVPTTAVHLVR